MKTFKMIVSSYTRCIGCDEGPFWIEFTVNQAFIHRLQQMAEICTEFDLECIECRMCPDCWENEDEYPLSGHGLCVLGNMFYFKAYHKYSDDVVETELVRIIEIVGLTENDKHYDSCRWLDGVLFYSDHLDGLIETFTRSCHEKSV